MKIDIYDYPMTERAIRDLEIVARGEGVSQADADKASEEVVFFADYLRDAAERVESELESCSDAEEREGLERVASDIERFRRDFARIARRLESVEVTS